LPAPGITFKEGHGTNVVSRITISEYMGERDTGWVIRGSALGYVCMQNKPDETESQFLARNSSQ